MAKEAGIEHTTILGVEISSLTLRLAMEIIIGEIDSASQLYVCVANVHLIMECQRDSRLREIVNDASLTTPDGMPLVWLSKWAGRRQTERVYGPALMLRLCEAAAQQGRSVFLVGGLSGTTAKLSETLTNRFSGLNVVGAIDTPNRPTLDEDDEHIVAEINKSKPDIVFVGIGCPHQERWMGAHREAVSAPVLIGVGAAFDFITGRVKVAPEWMQKSGLEWLYRLSREPKKLAKRYLVNNPIFIALVLKQIMLGKLK